MAGLAILALLETVPAQATSMPSLLVFFDPGSAEVAAKADGALNFAVGCVWQGGLDLVVHGYTDTAEADMLLSQTRANAVKDRLLQMGVPPDRVHVQTGPSVSRAENRHAEIVCVRK